MGAHEAPMGPGRLARRRAMVSVVSMVSTVSTVSVVSVTVSTTMVSVTQLLCVWMMP